MDEQETLKITVAKRTAEGLRKVARETSMTIGEIVDELASETVPTDPKTATIFAL